jgi:hypothetical protein
LHHSLQNIFLPRCRLKKALIGRCMMVGCGGP